MRATAVAVAVAVCAAAVPARATPPPTIATVAGSLGTGNVADVGQYPVGVAYSGGRVYLADMLWNAVRGLDPASGREDVVAGTGNVTFTGADGPARRAGLDGPLSVAAATDGSLVVGTYRRVLRVGRDGVLRVLAGGGDVRATEGVAGRAAELGRVTGVAVAPDGTVYLAQPDAFRVFRLAPDGTLHVVAGNGLSASGVAAPGVAAAYPMRPHGVALDADGSVLVADSENQRVLRVDRTGVVTVVADVPGAAGVAAGRDGSVLVAGRRLSAVSRGGTVTTLSTTGGLAVTAGAGGDVWWVDATSVYRRGADRVTRRLTGGPGYDRPHGGAPSRLQTWQPLAIATHRGAVYWTDLDTLAWRVADGRARVVTSNDEPFFDPLGGPESHHLVSPEGIAVDAGGVVYVSDPRSSVVYRLTPRGRVPVAGETRICAGWSDRTKTGDGGPATKASLCAPQGLAAADGRLYVADAGNQRVRVVDARGRISTLAGTGEAGFSGDGGPASRARLRYPGDVEVAGGSVYVADTENSVIRRIGRDGVIRTIAGTPGRLGYSGDGGRATAATFWYPTGIAVARDGTVYVADMGNDAVRRIDPRGVVTTLAGGHANAFAGDGGSARAASLGCPGDVALDEAAHLLYVADTCNDRIRVVRLG
ncbi:MAG TPA: hypothetical protein VGX28_04515 [Frankiaceae bacterium]|jgi:sugar lactone lactonase YvrE|nr:hypothetical protein [Frankiaceae bacterium]